jgi:hypothetical protein
MTIHKFHKTNGGVYLSPVYVRDDGKWASIKEQANNKRNSKRKD